MEEGRALKRKKRHAFKNLLYFIQLEKSVAKITDTHTFSHKAMTALLILNCKSVRQHYLLIQ